MSTDSNGSARPTVIEGGLRTRMLEAGAEGFWEWNVSTGAVCFSKSCRIRLGYAPDEIGDNAADWKKFMHPDDLAAARKSVEDHLRGKTDSCEFELRLKCRDGSWRWMLARGQVIERTPEGRPRKVFGTHFDITGWREAQEKIDEQNRFLGTLVGNLPGMVYVCRNDPQWTMTFVSEGCRSVTGYEPADLLLNRTISYGDLVHPDDRDALWKKCQESLAQRIPCINQYRIINKAGNIRWVAERAVGVYSPDGMLLTIEGFVQEVTAQRSAEMERAKTEERLRQAVIASRMVWWEWDLSGNGLRVHACGTPCILGYDSIDLLKETGATWMEKVHPEERDAVARSLADTIEGRTQTWSVTHRLRAKNGSWQWVEQNGRATQRDGNDRALWMAGTTRDVHDSVEAQLEKRLSAKHLLKSQHITHLNN